MQAKEELRKLINEKIDIDELVNYIASNLDTSFQCRPIESKFPEVNGRYRLFGDDDTSIWKRLGLVKYVSVSDPWNTREGGYSSYLILTKKAERLHKKLKKDGFYSSKNIELERGLIHSVYFQQQKIYPV